MPGALQGLKNVEIAGSDPAPLAEMRLADPGERAAVINEGPCRIDRAIARNFAHVLLSK